MTIKTEQRVYNNSYFNVSNALNVQLLVLHMHTCIDFQYMTKFALTKQACTASLGLGL
jgi:ABC-type transporter MlaC component